MKTFDTNLQQLAGENVINGWSKPLQGNMDVLKNDVNRVNFIGSQSENNALTDYLNLISDNENGVYGKDKPYYYRQGVADGGILGTLFLQDFQNTRGPNKKMSYFGFTGEDKKHYTLCIIASKENPEKKVMAISVDPMNQELEQRKIQLFCPENEQTKELITKLNGIKSNTETTDLKQAVLNQSGKLQPFFEKIIDGDSINLKAAANIACLIELSGRDKTKGETLFSKYEDKIAEIVNSEVLQRINNAYDWEFSVGTFDTEKLTAIVDASLDSQGSFYSRISKLDPSRTELIKIICELKADKNENGCFSNEDNLNQAIMKKIWVDRYVIINDSIFNAEKATLINEAYAPNKTYTDYIKGKTTLEQLKIEIKKQHDVTDNNIITEKINLQIHCVLYTALAYKTATNEKNQIDEDKLNSFIGEYQGENDLKKGIRFEELTENLEDNIKSSPVACSIKLSEKDTRKDETLFSKYEDKIAEIVNSEVLKKISNAYGWEFFLEPADKCSEKLLKAIVDASLDSDSIFSSTISKLDSSKAELIKIICELKADENSTAYFINENNLNQAIMKKIWVDRSVIIDDSIFNAEKATLINEAYALNKTYTDYIKGKTTLEQLKIEIKKQHDVADNNITTEKSNLQIHCVLYTALIHKLTQDNPNMFDYLINKALDLDFLKKAVKLEESIEKLESEIKTECSYEQQEAIKTYKLNAQYCLTYATSASAKMNFKESLESANKNLSNAFGRCEQFKEVINSIIKIVTDFFSSLFKEETAISKESQSHATNGQGLFAQTKRGQVEQMIENLGEVKENVPLQVVSA